MLSSVSDEITEPLDRVRLIARGHQFPVRDWDPKKYDLLASAKIEDIAVSYCGADPEICTSAFIECAKLLLQKFGGIGIDEVKEAFAMAAAKKLGDIDLTSYKGVFTVATFGEVLTAYSEYRNMVLKNIQDTEEIQNRKTYEEKMIAQNEIVKQGIVVRFMELQNLNDQIQTPDQIPVFWVQILKSAGLIEGDRAEWVRAKQWVCEQFVSDAVAKTPDLSVSVERRVQLVSEMERNQDFFPSELQQRAENRYGRVLIFNKLKSFSE